MRQPSAMSADDSDSGAAQLLGNGGKIEPYTMHMHFDTPWATIGMGYLGLYWAILGHLGLAGLP
jgi:hypothetical protein